MRAAVLHAFGEAPVIENIAAPPCPHDGVIIEVKACGVCRSDHHGLMGHNPNVVLPHVLGHEFAGTIAETGRDVRRFKIGDRVTAPFILGCGTCPDCAAGNAPICDAQSVIGFSRPGAFAEYIAIDRADFNLVALPDGMAFASAAALGCRMTTAWRGLMVRARLQAGEIFCVHGCGGVGLSAIMIAKAIGARIIAVDINDDALHRAKKCGAKHVINAGFHDNVGEAVRAITSGGAHVSMDALGHKATFMASMQSLRKLGRHIQLGMPVGEHAVVELPLMDLIYSRQLQISGARGLAAAGFAPLLAMIKDGKIDADALMQRAITLADMPQTLMDMDGFTGAGVSVVTGFAA